MGGSVRLEDGQPSKVMPRKPNKRKNQESCSLGQMLPSGKEEDSDRAITGKSLGTMQGPTGFLYCWRWKPNLKITYSVKLTMRKRSPGLFA